MPELLMMLFVRAAQFMITVILINIDIAVIYSLTLETSCIY